MKTSTILVFQNLVSKLGVSALMTIAAFSINIALLSNQVASASTAESVSPQVDQEILWFARAIYSETKDPSEQTLVAWVIRNRVESKLFPNTYKEVVLQQGQFSGMHASDHQFTTNVSLGYGDTNPAWDSALSIARAVYYADPILRPLPKTVLHFYSPNAVAHAPSWATSSRLAQEVRDPATDTVHFAFYADVMGK